MGHVRSVEISFVKMYKDPTPRSEGQGIGSYMALLGHGFGQEATIVQTNNRTQCLEGIGTELSLLHGGDSAVILKISDNLAHQAVVSIGINVIADCVSLAFDLLQNVVDTSYHHSDYLSCLIFFIIH